MRRAVLLLLLTILPLLLFTSWLVMYKEEYYKFYHIHYQSDPTNIVENIYWLESARKAQFCNPLYAIAKIEDKAQYKKYQYLFDMHLDLKLIEQHIRLATGWDKKVAYFYNEPWKKENLASLEIAEKYYNYAKAYWADAMALAEKAGAMPWVYLPQIENWADESARIINKELDYQSIIDAQLSRIAKVRAEFESMPVPNY